MTPEEKLAIAKEVGTQAAAQIDKKFEDAEKKLEAVVKETTEKGAVSKATFDSYKEATDTAVKEAKEIIEKQGMSLQELSEKLNNGGGVEGKGIAETLEEHKDELKEVFRRKTGNMEFMLTVDANGRPTLKVHDPFAEKGTTKAAGPHATVGGVGGGGNVASITSSLSPAAILRASGITPAIFSAPRNTPWLLDVMNVIRASYEQSTAIWFEEQAKDGAAAIVPEGGTKPLVQYKYVAKSSDYKKAAHMLSFTQEFNLDFERLQNEIMTKGMIDLNNVMNAQLLTGVLAAATAYNTATQFNTGTGPVENVNDFDALIAMMAQVKDSQFGLTPNAALMSAFKEGRMAATKDTNGNYIDRPSYLNSLSFIGNPGMGTDNVIVGDLTNYNVIMRGGMIVRIGYNGTDFAENKFSVVQEQFFFDYIPDVRKSAIVKGTTFAAVKAAIAPAP